MPPAQQLILAVLAAAREAGAGQLTLTALVKFAYLADVLFAEERDGRTHSELRWLLLHYGPYAHAIEDELATLERGRLIERAQQEGRERDYQLFSLQEFARPPTLQQLGLSSEGRLIFASWLRRFAGDLPALLNFVYHQTEPMATARAGQELPMHLAVRPNYKRDIRPIPIPVRDPKLAGRARELMKRISERGAQARNATQLPEIKHDAVYWNEVPDDPEFPAEGGFVADISHMRT
jgi:hypothetical protein